MRRTINGREVTDSLLARLKERLFRLVDDPGGVWGWLENHDPNLCVELLLTDQFWSAIIFHDAIVHTLSWHIACLARGGLTAAQKACSALNFLSPDHCAQAILLEGPCP